MKYEPPFRIQNGQVFEFEADRNAYTFYGNKTALSKDNYQAIQNLLSIYDANYDKKQEVKQ